MGNSSIRRYFESKGFVQTKQDHWGGIPIDQYNNYSTVKRFVDDKIQDGTCVMNILIDEFHYAKIINTIEEFNMLFEQIEERKYQRFVRLHFLFDRNDIGGIRIAKIYNVNEDISGIFVEQQFPKKNWKFYSSLWIDKENPFFDERLLKIFKFLFENKKAYATFQISLGAYGYTFMETEHPYCTLDLLFSLPNEFIIYLEESELFDKIIKMKNETDEKKIERIAFHERMLKETGLDENGQIRGESNRVAIGVRQDCLKGESDDQQTSEMSNGTISALPEQPSCDLHSRGDANELNENAEIEGVTKKLENI